MRLDQLRLLSSARIAGVAEASEQQRKLYRIKPTQLCTLDMSNVMMYLRTGDCESRARRQLTEH